MQKRINEELNKIINCIIEFKEVIFSKKVRKLSYWIKKAKKINVKELNSFITLIESDIEAVKNAIKYEYSNVIISRTDRTIPVPVFPDFNFAEAIKLIEYSGYLKAGTDFSKVKPSYDEVSKRLLVKVPKSYILDNVVETEKTKVEDVKGNIFSDYPTQTIIDEINAHKKQLEEEKISNGFLEEADKRAELLLISHYSSNGYDEVIIEFY